MSKLTIGTKTKTISGLSSLKLTSELTCFNVKDHMKAIFDRFIDTRRFCRSKELIGSALPAPEDVANVVICSILRNTY